MNQVKGGANCTCSSSVAGNGKANYDGGKKTRLSDGGVWIPDVIVTP